MDFEVYPLSLFPEFDPWLDFQHSHELGQFDLPYRDVHMMGSYDDLPSIPYLSPDTQTLNPGDPTGPLLQCGATKVDSLQSHRHCIERIYYSQERTTLKDIQRQHNQSCGLAISEKMYKYYIKKWGLRKYLTEPEVKAIVRKRHQRSSAGKQTLYAVGARNVTDEEVNRFLQRRKLAVGDILAERKLMKSPPAVRCYTPEPITIRPPDTFRDMEMFFSSIKIYMVGSIESRRSKGELSDVYFADDMDLARTLLWNNDPIAAGKVLNRACSWIQKIVSLQHPRMLDRVLRVLHRLQRFPGVVKVVSDAFCEMSSAVHGSCYPLNQVWAYISRLTTGHVDSFENLKTVAYDLISSQFVQRYGEFHPLALGCRRRYLAANRNPWELKRLWDSGKGTTDQMLSEVMCDIAVSAAETFQRLYYHKESMDVLEEFTLLFPLPRDPANQDYRLLCRLHSSIKRSKARVLHSLGQRDKAVTNLEEAIQLRLDCLSSKGPRTIELILVLEDWMTQSGRIDEAAAFRRKRLELLDLIEPLPGALG